VHRGDTAPAAGGVAVMTNDPPLAALRDLALREAIQVLLDAMRFSEPMEIRLKAADIALNELPWLNDAGHTTSVTGVDLVQGEDKQP
jgi:hypothetical protein